MKPQEPTSKPLVLTDRQSERIEFWVRAVCGFLLGLFLATLVWAQLGGVGLVATVLLYVAMPVVCAYGTVKHGDGFWERVLRNPFL